MRLYKSWWKEAELLPDRIAANPSGAFLITFDDALSDLLDEAFPVAEAEGVRGIAFAVAGYLGKKASWDPSPGPKALHLDAAGLRELLKAGWAVGSHSWSHPDLTALSESEALRELERSKKALEDAVGAEVWAFSYPFGRFNARVMELVARAGYSVAFAEDYTRSRWHPFAIPRIGIYLPDYSPRFKLTRLGFFANRLIQAFGRLSPFVKHRLGWAE